mmetsp:Transcript_81854/g.208002  ORF Transcript_81854/g.208002 Transcript_81854/m.208002 type:complete len:228 (-) Transcript_81854:944-1627(-)
MHFELSRHVVTRRAGRRREVSKSEATALRDLPHEELLEHVYGDRPRRPRSRLLQKSCLPSVPLFGGASRHKSHQELVEVAPDVIHCHPTQLCDAMYSSEHSGEHLPGLLGRRLGRPCQHDHAPAHGRGALQALAEAARSDAARATGASGARQPTGHGALKLIDLDEHRVVGDRSLRKQLRQAVVGELGAGQAKTIDGQPEFASEPDRELGLTDTWRSCDHVDAQRGL